MGAIVCDVTHSLASSSALRARLHVACCRAHLSKKALDGAEPEPAGPCSISTSCWPVHTLPVPLLGHALTPSCCPVPSPPPSPPPLPPRPSGDRGPVHQQRRGALGAAERPGAAAAARLRRAGPGPQQVGATGPRASRGSSQQGQQPARAAARLPPGPHMPPWKQQSIMLPTPTRTSPTSQKQHAPALPPLLTPPYTSSASALPNAQHPCCCRPGPACDVATLLCPAAHASSACCSCATTTRTTCRGTAPRSAA